MFTLALQRVTTFVIAVMVVVGISFAAAKAQKGSVPDAKVGPSQKPKIRVTIPVVRVSPRSSIDQLPKFPAMSSKRPTSADMRLLTPPPPLSSDARTALLRDAGINITPVSAPHDFRLSPRQPYISSSAYLFFSGALEFNASSDNLVFRIDEPSPIPPPRVPGFPDSSWASGGPQPDPPAIVGVLVRMDAASRYLADFSVSTDAPTMYQLAVTGAEGSGSFFREAGGQHVLVVLDSIGGGYARINFGSGRSFTFHNVVMTKLN